MTTQHMILNFGALKYLLGRLENLSSLGPCSGSWGCGSCRKSSFRRRRETSGSRTRWKVSEFWIRRPDRNLVSASTTTELVLTRPTSGTVLRLTVSDIVRDRGVSVLIRG